MGRVLLTAPTEEPITVQEAKTHLREDGDGQDSVIEALVKAARLVAELETERALVTQAWRVTLDVFPECGFIRLPLPPLVSVQSLKYINSSGVLTTVATADYVVDTGSLPGKIDLAYGVSWPTARYEPNAIRVEFTCGYGTSEDVPEAIKAAMKLLVGHLYENREAVNVGESINEFPLGVKHLLWPYRVMEAA